MFNTVEVKKIQVLEVFGPMAHPYFSIRIHQNDGKELSYAVGSILCQQ